MDSFSFILMSQIICLILLLLSVLSVSCPRNHCQVQCHETFFLCFLLRVLEFHLFFLDTKDFNVYSLKTKTFSYGSMVIKIKKFIINTVLLSKNHCLTFEMSSFIPVFFRCFLPWFRIQSRIMSCI